MSQLNLVFLKLGGSLITHKSRPYTVQRRVLERLTKELAGILKVRPGLRLVVGNGGGSFSHVSAAHYTQLKRLDEPEAIAVVRGDAAQLNRIVVKTLLAQGVYASSFPPSCFMFARNGKIVEAYLDPLIHALTTGVTPVIHGDVLGDASRGTWIASTETQLNYLALQLKGGYRIERILQAGVEEGVYDGSGGLIPEINKGNYEWVKQSLGGSAGIDVTGGMRHKVGGSIKLARQGIETFIFSGMVPGRLYRAMLGEKVPGTRIWEG